MNRAMPPKLDPKSDTARIQLIAPESWIARVNAWRRTQPDLPNVSEAIRRLVDAALATDTKKRPRK